MLCQKRVAIKGIPTDRAETYCMLQKDHPGNCPEYDPKADFDTLQIRLLKTLAEKTMLPIKVIRQYDNKDYR